MCHNRYTELQELARTDYAGVHAMARTWSRIVRTKANNERAVQIRYFKKVWLSNNSPYKLVRNCIEQDLNVMEGQMEVCPALSVSGLTTVAQVRACLKSNAMYTYPVMYRLLCEGVESGQLKQTTAQDPTSILNLLTIAHEANIRVELYFALKVQRYRHTPTDVQNVKRTKKWNTFCQLVKQDRAANEAAATQARLGAGGVGHNIEAGNDDDDDDAFVETIDPSYH
jgi:hypothetical protein